MTFGKLLLPKVLDGTKTVTRRPYEPKHRHKPPWRMGRTYAIQPGRGAFQVARFVCLSVRKERLNVLLRNPEEAIPEGFETVGQFVDYWIAMYGKFDPSQWVWRVEFVLSVQDRELVPA